ncbi:helix-turn-helix domain-containing protein [Pseudomonas syringae]|uniref:helix-turn-helix domain-containing protein n=1 Tax=Pseudomonas syringae TaxID=317 RepID=UPI003F74F55E
MARSPMVRMQAGYLHRRYFATPLEIAVYRRWEYSSRMSTERRDLHDWEKRECAALKAALAEHNARLPKAAKLTQEEIAHQVGMSQGTLGSHLNGHRPVTQKLAVAMAKLLDIPISKFSSRLSEELSQLAAAVGDHRHEVEADPVAHTPASASPPPGTSIAAPVVAVLITNAIADGRLSGDDAEELRRMAVHLIKKNERITESVTPIPSQFEGLSDAVFAGAEAGENVDDMLKMIEHGMKKSQPKDSAKHHEVVKKKHSN